MIGQEKNFYDPFNMNHCGYEHRMSCLDTNKELIAFKQDARHQRMQMTYFLRWLNEGEYNSEWSLYQADEDNKLSIINSGTGLETYKTTLFELNIDPELILWGNLNDKKSLAALN